MAATGRLLRITVRLQIRREIRESDPSRSTPAPGPDRYRSRRCHRPAALRPGSRRARIRRCRRRRHSTVRRRSPCADGTASVPGAGGLLHRRRRVRPRIADAQLLLPHVRDAAHRRAWREWFPLHHPMSTSRDDRCAAAFFERYSDNGDKNKTRSLPDMPTCRTAAHRTVALLWCIIGRRCRQIQCAS